MCGRFTATFSFRDIKVRWNLQGDLAFEPRYNIAPSQSVPVIIKGKRGNEAKLMKWGLVPSWAPDPSIGNRMINARAETLLEKASFRNLVSQRGCLIPADGFYEWRREDNRKMPMWIYLKSRKPFAFPELWDCWLDRDTGSELYSFTIITTRANALVRRLHDVCR
jgi:putative SOS response-associated peptidase YedK